MTFAVEADSNKRFVALMAADSKPSGTNWFPQHLHALTSRISDFTHPDFWDDARLADFHRSHYGQSVNVVRVGKFSMNSAPALRIHSDP
ncbi:MAG: hypothetical protein IPP17_30750 [Bacteroidetes bacterium]|nr:hypothetical protein [Bacteroidota bacterium]